VTFLHADVFQPIPVMHANVEIPLRGRLIAGTPGGRTSASAASTLESAYPDGAGAVPPSMMIRTSQAGRVRRMRFAVVAG
jgi:hypothetical protein